MVVISDTSCLIVLNKLDQLDLLRQLYGSVLITSIVRSEFGAPLPDWFNVVIPPETELYQELKQQLDADEASSIALAKTIQDCLLIVDEAKGRKVASQLEVSTLGTLGMLLKAKEAGLIESLRTLLTTIRDQTNFRFSEAIAIELLIKAGEL
jgi:predicted nucleic acid-binding protein